MIEGARGRRQTLGEGEQRPRRSGSQRTGHPARADQSSTGVHGIIIVTPGDLVISALSLSLSVESLPICLIGAKICKAYKSFGELEEDQIP